MRARPLLLALGLLVAAPARPATPPPGGVADLAGPRTLGLAGATGVVSGNDGLFVNPAATAVQRRYSIESLFLVDRRGADSAGQYLGASVVDSISAPAAASLAWVRSTEGAQRGNLFVGGLAGAIADSLYLGAQLRYYDLSTTTSPPSGPATSVRTQAVTADVGLFWAVSDLISVGAAGFNLLPIGHPQVAPRAVAAGLALGSDTSVKLTLDWRADLDRVRHPVTGKAVTTNRYGAGLEVLLGALVPLRAGYLVDDTLDTTWWCAGAGLVTRGGVGLDFGYRQSLDAANARVLGLTLKLQFLEP
ncbi:MAG: hypothetical protein IPO09_04680 [Anaeromyxobacter sp.]|nr:hypothetical protein [Anaeromyxobacter sp.]MBL0275880.1 hypothetical protein [Anaeromyxobacter sp.]